MKSETHSGFITYVHNDEAPEVTTVKLLRKTIGHIVQSRKGFRYTPKGSLVAGDFFPTLGACKKSLEAT